MFTEREYNFERMKFDRAKEVYEKNDLKMKEMIKSIEIEFELIREIYINAYLTKVQNLTKNETTRVCGMIRREILYKLENRVGRAKIEVKDSWGFISFYRYFNIKGCKSINSLETQLSLYEEKLKEKFKRTLDFDY
ncbi:MAG: hypothetical protein ACRCXT_23925 [Paraclostridium sp.]